MTSRSNQSPTAWSDQQVLDLVRTHERLVSSYLRARGCPEDRVDDLAQETFLRLFTGPAKDRSLGELRGYLCTVARNLFLNTFRSESSGPKVEALDPDWAQFEGEDGGTIYLDALSGCLEKLPRDTREVLRLRFGCDLPRKAIADHVQSSLGAVKSVLLRSKEQLRDCIQAKLGIEKLNSARASR